MLGAWSGVYINLWLQRAKQLPHRAETPLLHVAAVLRDRDNARISSTANQFGGFTGSMDQLVLFHAPQMEKDCKAVSSILQGVSFKA